MKKRISIWDVYYRCLSSNRKKLPISDVDKNYLISYKNKIKIVHSCAVSIPSPKITIKQTGPENWEQDHIRLETQVRQNRRTQKTILSAKVSDNWPDKLPAVFTCDKCGLSFSKSEILSTYLSYKLLGENNG